MFSVFPGIMVLSLDWFWLTFISRVSICEGVFGVTVLGVATFSHALDKQAKGKVEQELFQHTAVSERSETNSLQQS